MERMVSCASKCTHTLWDHAGFDPPSLAEQAAGASEMKAFDLLRQMLRTGREPPKDPAVFAETMRARVGAGELSFSHPGDMELVIRM